MPADSQALVDLLERGFAWLPAYDPEVDTLSISRRFGTPLHLPGIAESQRLQPRDVAASTPNIYSGNYGYDAFPLHTDLAHWFIPPRYFVLRCVVGSSVTTHLLDSRPLATTIGLSALSRTLVQPRRRCEGRRPLLHLSEHQDGWSFIRWDQLFLVPATRSARTVLEAFAGLIRSATTEFVSLRNPGDTLLIDNARMLHGRSAVPEAAVGRLVERVYLQESLL